MKKIIIAITLLAGTFFYQNATAQIRVSINIGTQPVWGPTGYDYAQYYYMPEMDVYYDIQNRMYYYPNGNRWTPTATLPARYGRYNIYNTYKVVMNQNQPWRNAQTNRRQYATYRNRHDQGIIRDSRESRYWENAQHPRHNEWARGRGNNNNNGRGGIQRDGQRRDDVRGTGDRRDRAGDNNNNNNNGNGRGNDRRR